MRTTVAIVLALSCLLPREGRSQTAGSSEERVVIQSGGWQLVGDLHVPSSDGPVPGVLMLNQAAWTRTDYVGLARALADRGVASLRLDLRGHGESVNLGRFVPGERERDPLIWDAESDVVSAHRYLMSRPEIDPDRIAVVGASYSGEEMAEAARRYGYAQAYVALSPGSFSTASIQGIDASGVPWLFVASRDERFLREITATVRAESRTVDMMTVPGAAHATGLLETHDDLAERIAVWLFYRLR